MKLSPSQITAFLKCRRSWMLSYHRQLQAPPQPDAASAGTAMHRLLAERHGGEAADLDAVYAEARKASPVHTIELLAEKKAAVASVDTAQAELDILDAGIEVVGTEVEFDAPIGVVAGEPVSLYGFMDLVWRDGSGRLIVRDWKSKVAFRLPAPMELNIQLLTYVLALHESTPHHTGGHVPAAEIVLVKRHKGSGRAKGPFVQHHRVEYTLPQLQVHKAHALAIAEQIIVARQRLAGGADHHVVAPPTPGDHCFFACDFKAVCPIMDSDPEHAENLLQVDFVPRTSPAQTETGVL